MIILVGIILIILGLISVFAGDLVWKLTVIRNKWEGKASERTGFWDFGRKLGGYFLILVGIGLLIFGLIEPGLNEQREAERKLQQEESSRLFEQQTEELIQEYLEKAENE